jgi:hypothetical protein
MLSQLGHDQSIPSVNQMSSDVRCDEFAGYTGLSRSVLVFVLVSSKNLARLGCDGNRAKSDRNPIESMVLCVWQAMRRDGLKWPKVDF